MRMPAAALFAAVALGGCNAPDPPGSTGGTHLAPGSCGRGLVVVSTDFASSNISLLGLDGRVLSSSFLSSAGTVDLSARLSGDVALPTAGAAGDEVVIIDQKVSVLSFVGVANADVRGQLAFGAGENPHDYLVLGADRAVVSRYDRGPKGEGSDLVVVRPKTGETLRTVSLAPAMTGVDAKFLPTPWHLLPRGGEVIVTLNVENAAHTESAAARLAVVDPESGEVKQVLPLPGLHECNGIAPSPDGSRLALACTGSFIGTADANPAESALVLLETEPKLKEIERIAADGAPFGYGVGWVSSHSLLAVTLGALDSSGLDTIRKDALLEIDLDTKERRTVLESVSQPFELRDVRCASACGACFLSDHERGVVHRVPVGEDGHAGTPQPIVVDSEIGLPPYVLGQF
jgi:hypothetical protein